MEQYNELIDEGKLFLNKNKCNIFKIQKLFDILESESFDIKKYDELLLFFSVNIFQVNTGFSSVESPKFLEYMEREVYNVLSDNKNKAKVNILVTSMIGGLGTTIANALKLEPFIVTGFLNLITLSVIKIGVGAWCTYYEEKKRSFQNQIIDKK